MDSLQKETLVGSIWMMVERFGYLSIQFISNLVLARILMPDDFGTIGILTVFVALANVLIDSGFSSSLIQKKEITDIDKSTVFYTNLILSAIVYLVVFFLSPFIADYFHNPELKILLRVLEIVVLIDAFCAIQNTILIRNMNFKCLTKIKLTTIIIAATVAIILAYMGLGIWALIVQYILYSCLRTTITWLVAEWRPLSSFSKQSFKTLFGYGSKLLFSQFVAELYVNFQQILIGRFYTSADLGYYSQARLFQQIPAGTISQVINSVAFPAYAKLQNRREELREMFRKNVRLVAFINIPLMCLLAVIAQPLIVLFYSDKWVGAISYFQFLCICFGIFLVIHQCSLSVLKAVGRSDYILRLEIIKKSLGVILILIGIKVWGLWGILYALSVNSFIEIFLNGYYLDREIRYNGVQQLLDMLPSIIVAVIASVISYFTLITICFTGHEFIAVCTGSLLFISCYFLGAWIGKLYGFGVLLNGVKKVYDKLNKK